MAKRIIPSLSLILALNFLPPPALAFPLVFTGSSRGETLVHSPPAAPLKRYAPDGFKTSRVSETSSSISCFPAGDEFFRVARPDLQKPASRSVSISFSAYSSVSPGSSKLREPGNLPRRVLTYASVFLDTPYRAGGSLQTGKATDCSGFVQYVYGNFHIDLPRSSSEQARVGTLAARKMDFSKLRPGDLLFFKRRGFAIGHVGIYLGEGKMIHASCHRRGVIVSDLHQPYYRGAFVVAKRLLESPAK